MVRVTVFGVPPFLGIRTNWFYMSPPFDYYVVVDFEATADEGNPPRVARDESEIIEFAWVVFDSVTFEIVYSNHIYVKPERTPITPFCKQLTGISDHVVESAGTLQGAVAAFQQYVDGNIIGAGKSFCLVTDGVWDLSIQLPRECNEKGITLNEYFSRYYDLKNEYTKWLRAHQLALPVRLSAEGVLNTKSTLKAMCAMLGVYDQELPRRSVDQCRKIAHVSIELLRRQLGNVFAEPIDIKLELQKFSTARETVVLVKGTPFSATLADIRRWFESHGCAAPNTVHCVMVDFERGKRPAGAVLACFDTHEDAVAAIALNGRVLGPRYLYIRPSSQAELAGENTIVLTPGVSLNSLGTTHPQLPAPTKTVQYRPGDWICSVLQCEAHNFHYRVECFRCGAPNPSGMSMTPAFGSLPSAAAAYTWVPAAVGAGRSPGESQTQTMWLPRMRQFPSSYATLDAVSYASTTASAQAQYAAVVNTNAGPDTAAGVTSLPYYFTYPMLPHSAYQAPLMLAHQPRFRRERTEYRAGDWMCPVPSCGGHNFARRASCRSCGFARPLSVDMQGHTDSQFSGAG